MYILQVGRLKGVSFLSLDQSICCRLVLIDKFTRSVLLNTGSCHLIPFQEYEEVIIPPAKPIPRKAEERLMPVSELEELVKGCFTVILESPHRWPRNLLKDQGYTSLNRIQSIVYPTAYGSNENLLICGTIYSAML
jgi:antiviral helicase SLH1